MVNRYGLEGDKQENNRHNLCGRDCTAPATALLQGHCCYAIGCVGTLERHQRVQNWNKIWSTDMDLKGASIRTIDIISVEETVQHQPLCYCKALLLCHFLLGHKRDNSEHRIGIKYDQQIGT